MTWPWSTDVVAPSPQPGVTRGRPWERWFFKNIAGLILSQKKGTQEAVCWSFADTKLLIKPYNGDKQLGSGGKLKDV